MLMKLTISNFALIDELSVTFEPGLNIITGETGAGKSIILGALSLILGARADTAVIRDTSNKCMVEGVFNIERLPIKDFFLKNDLDYDQISILRREIAPSGKTRAFINDTPVTLYQLRELTLSLVDIHSQHQNLELGNQEFQLMVMDVVSQSETLLNNYQKIYRENLRLHERLKKTLELTAKARTDHDYHQFQFDQLSEANLKQGEQEEMESEREKLTHAEDIKGALAHVSELFSGERFPILQQVKESLTRIGKISSYLKEADDIYHRLESVYLELQDIDRETGYLAENIEFHPQRLEEISQRLDLIYTLQQKHQLSTVEDLIALKESLSKKISEIFDFETEIQQIEHELDVNKKEIQIAASELSEKRKGVFSETERHITSTLQKLGMPHAVFNISHSVNKDFSPQGIDKVQFLFSANKNGVPEEISHIASGGEISRLMLALKTLLSGSKMLPTIIFDEIDAGISGEVALKTGVILRKLSKDMQVINITHLPQIAGMGDHHYKVFKFESEATTFTSIRKLDMAERVEELATMVGGANPTEAARKTARELLRAG